MKMVKVVWHDAITNSKWFSNIEEAIAWAEIRNGCKVISIGFLVHKTRDYILLAQGAGLKTSYNQRQYLGLLQIPKGAIKEMKEIKE